MRAGSKDIAVSGTGDRAQRPVVDGSPVEQRRPSNGGANESDPGASYRGQLTSGEDIVDPSTWAGSVPVAHGIAPRVRVGRARWFNLLWLLPIGFVLLIVAVATAKGLRNMASVQRFIADHPGTVARCRGSAHCRRCRSGSVCSTSSTCSC